MNKRILITGGCGFIGSYLVKKLVEQGNRVEVLDNLTRGSMDRLEDFRKDINWLDIDIRNESAIAQVLKGVDTVYHLAAINGTENFYKKPDLVLDVGIRGVLSIVNGCIKGGVKELVVASTAEVYQTPILIPTPENIELKLPNSINPRYSYGGSKIITELVAMNYGRKHFEKLQIFRPHNVYGPNMGWKHVIPQFINRLLEVQNSNDIKAKFTVMSKLTETRAFAYIDDVIEGIILMQKNGSHREVYNIGNDYEISILNLAQTLMKVTNNHYEIVESEGLTGGTPRRCPDISKLRSIGYKPKVSLVHGLEKTYKWYKDNQNVKPENELS